ncbi:MAG: hypothetical protein LBT04_06175 [Prevotellaceae bacterium]|nr:hypothetical protein [Prevotellaceae bacterium]
MNNTRREFFPSLRSVAVTLHPLLGAAAPKTPQFPPENLLAKIKFEAELEGQKNHLF